jgi:hypothetical protein
LSQGREATLLASALGGYQLDNPGGVWDGILWNRGAVDATEKARDTAFHICLSYMGILEADRHDSFVERLSEVRKDPGYKLPDRKEAPKRDLAHQWRNQFAA